MYKADFSLWIHVRGKAELDFKPETPEDLTDYIFSDDCSCEILGVTEDPNHNSVGYLNVTELNEED